MVTNYGKFLQESCNIASETIEQGTCWIGKDKFAWKKEPFQQGRAQAHNILRGPCNKPIVYANEVVDSPEDVLLFFLDEKVLTLIIKFTNLYGNNHCKNWKDVDMIELKAFIGLLYLGGLNKQGISDCRDFWDPLFGITLFSAAISRSRFQEINRCLRFDDKRFRNSNDKFAPIRSLWDIVMANLQRRYVPGENLTIDEQLVPYRGRVSFRQYIPSKPDKYGMKIWWVCNSSNAYPLFGIPYLGREGDSRATNLGKSVVLNLAAKYENSGRNITLDNFFFQQRTL